MLEHLKEVNEMALRDTLGKYNTHTTRFDHAPSRSARRSMWTSRSTLVAALCLVALMAAVSKLTAQAQVQCMGGGTENGASASAVRTARVALSEYRDECINIKFPKAWKMETLKRGHSARTLNGQIDISWSTTKLKSGVDLKKYSQVIVDRFVSQRNKKLFVERVISDSDATINGTAARKILTQCVVETKNGSKYKLQQQLVIAVSRGNGTLLTCTAPSAYYHDFEPVFDDAVGSLSF